MNNGNPFVSRLGLAWPVVQGPFGGGLSTPHLVAAVSNRGALGSFGAHMVAPGDIAGLVASIRARTTKPFAVNLWVSDHDPGGIDFSRVDFERHRARIEPYYRELGLAIPEMPASTGQRFDPQIDALIEARPPVFSFVFGVPSRVVMEKCRRAGIATLGTATTVAEAEALEAAGVDAIVATGMEAGGHRPSFLAGAEASLTGTFALVQLVAARVKVPVVAAGGIVDGRGVRAAMLLGAHAAQLGTAFLACEESGAAAEHRAMLFGAAARHTTLTRAFTGRLARGIQNRWTREIRDHAPYPLQSWLMGALKRAAGTRTDLSSLWSGQIAPNLKHHNVPALMDALELEIPA